MCDVCLCESVEERCECVTCVCESTGGGAGVECVICVVTAQVEERC